MLIARTRHVLVVVSSNFSYVPDIHWSVERDEGVDIRQPGQKVVFSKEKITSGILLVGMNFQHIDKHRVFIHGKALNFSQVTVLSTEAILLSTKFEDDDFSAVEIQSIWERDDVSHTKTSS